MPDVLVPVGRHLFTPDQLNKLAATVQPDGKHKVVGRAALDNEGTRVAVLFSFKEDRIVARTALGYDWDDGLGFGADLTFKLFGR